MLEKLTPFEQRYAQLEERLADPAVAASPAEYKEAAVAHASLRAIALAARTYREVLNELEGARGMVGDPDEEVRELARAEVESLEVRRDELEGEIRVLLVPVDPNDEKNAILEIRAGTGGDEAALFAADLLRMYSRYAERCGWKIEPISTSLTDGGGVREVIANVTGKNIYSRLKHERGVHRVQRVPATESQGRIHTSTVTVAVMPEAEEVDVAVDPSDLRIDVYRASGPGGQSVNTTDSAVRITHVPTGLVVQCQDEKSQHKNKAKAMKVLRSRLLEQELQREADARASARREQVGTGGRSEKIRTYNFPQSRVTDHRAGVTLHKLDAMIEGDLDELLDAVHVYMAAVAAEESGTAG
ncbi:MAG: peptide chain release factor 1 [Myxococcota bacterium]